MTLYLNYWTLISFSLLITTSPYWPSMPHWHFAVLPLTVLLASVKYRKVRYSVGLALACVVILVHGNLLRYKTEMLFQSGQDITITADVDSLFKPINYGFQGIVIVRSINGQALTSLARPKVRLKGPVRLEPGDEISARVKIDPIYGLMNQVGFDAEKYALGHSVVGVARVNAKQSFYTVSEGSLRSVLINRMAQQTRGLESQGMIRALVFGLRDQISSPTWQQLKQSGLSHLISISGLHIAIAFAIGWAIGRFVMRLHYAMSLMPVVLGLGLAWGYAWLAGFSIPTQRAVLTCCLLVIIHYRSGKVPNSYKWLLVLAGMLIISPFSVVSSSLWMSMYAVAVIMLCQSLTSNSQSWLMGMVKLQLALVIAMAPIVVYYFQGVSVGSVAYNLLFVPWFSWLVMPLAFVALSAMLAGVGTSWLWSAVDWSLYPVNWMLIRSEWGWYQLSQWQLKWLLTGLFVFSLLWLIRRKAMLLILSMLVLSSINWSATPSWQLTTLDVGHGLAVVVEQDEQALLYDTGAGWETSSIAEQVITPYLIQQGIDNLNYFIISHFDNDHAGGWQDVVTRWQPKTLISSQQLTVGQGCTRGKRWRWQQIEIEALWPPNQVERAYNAHSCVVRVTHLSQGSSVLLSGDIDSVAEWLLMRQGDDLSSNLVVVPHHGSDTSSVAEFVAALSPGIAIASTAYKGRWNLPNQQVVSRYEKSGANWFDTGHDGQITVKFYPNHTSVRSLRRLKGQTWYRQMLRKGVE